MSPTDPRLQLAPPDSKARVWLFVLVVMLPVLLVTAILAWEALGGQAQDSVGGGIALSSLATLGGVMLLTLALWWVLARFMHRQALSLDAARLEVRSSFYRTSVALDALDLEHARVVDLDERTELRPALKTNGFALPGFRSGWFRLRNRRRAFVALAAGRRRLWLPTRGGHDLLLEPRDARALLERLRELAGASARR
ncbi:hypothetical protein [Pseudoxanthomonas mexicana]|uniref:hypothetical protein n=1 Tax=Pseudoxanthomonas mexicana TaxID=128785 RepID=UPI00398AC135